jgi:hypothetical protein
MRTSTVVLAALFLVAAPIVAASEDGGPDENATWGLCTAQNNSDQGDDASNGTVSDTPPFNNTSEEDCDDAEHPANGTPGEDHAPSDPGKPDDPGQGDDGDEGQDDDNREDDDEGQDDENRP